MAKIWWVKPGSITWLLFELLFEFWNAIYVCCNLIIILITWNLKIQLLFAVLNQLFWLFDYYLLINYYSRFFHKSIIWNFMYQFSSCINFSFFMYQFFFINYSTIIGLKLISLIQNSIIRYLIIWKIPEISWKCIIWFTYYLKSVLFA